MSDSSPTVQRVADAYQWTENVLRCLSDLCIEVEGWPDSPGGEETDQLRHLRTALFQALGNLGQALLRLQPFLVQLGLGPFKRVEAVGRDSNRTLALGTALRGDPADTPLDTPLSADQARLARKCVERLREKDLADLQVEADRAFWGALEILGATRTKTPAVKGEARVEKMAPGEDLLTTRLETADTAGSSEQTADSKTDEPEGPAKAKIPAEERTVPLSYRRAAKLMGKGDSKDAAELLSALVHDGTIKCEHLSRQAHIFSKHDFPQPVWPQILPLAPPGGPK